LEGFSVGHYLSSIKVNGEHTGLRCEESGYRKKNEKIRFSETDTPNPQDPYAVSKWEAEQLLHDIATETGMEVVIVRPPLVYGPGVKANFLRLLQFVEKGLPLPLASIRNKRSMVSLDNLVDFLICCLEHPAAAGEIFLISDGEDVSTPELIQRIASQIKRPARLFPVPVNLLKLVAKLTCKTAELDRLCGSLQVDISKAKKVLGWEPPFSVDQGLAKTVAWYTKR
jgi:nucleoside-diphosphate-sugar epimerase